MDWRFDRARDDLLLQFEHKEKDKKERMINRAEGPKTGLTAQNENVLDHFHLAWSVTS